MAALLETSWLNLALANYAIAPAALAAVVPRGTTLDVVDGLAYVSVVGFEWARPRWWGVPAPFHGRFAELNLRTYVHAGDRAGVVFLRELVGMPVVAWLGRDVYGEPFTLARVEPAHGPGARLGYRWNERGAWETLDLEPEATHVPTGPPAAFYLDRGWAFTGHPRASTRAYAVQRASGQVQQARATLVADVARLYGAPYVEALAAPPASALVATGSPVRVAAAERLG